jgi:hypothetical protein
VATKSLWESYISSPQKISGPGSDQEILNFRARCARNRWFPPCAQADNDSRGKGAYRGGVFRDGGQPAALRWDITHGRLENVVLGNFGSSLDRGAGRLRGGVHETSKPAIMGHDIL